MKIYSVFDEEFKEFGQVLIGYDFSELLAALAEKEIPENGIVYVASDKRLEACAVTEMLRKRGFGGYPIQIGYVSGKNRIMNCLEYHKSSEFNIAADDMVLILGNEKDIEDGKYSSEKCKAFLVKAGMGVELYGTTLHYAPFHVKEEGYRVACVLPRGTNEPREDIEIRNEEDKLCFGINKWLMAHPDSNDAKNGVYPGITGYNITYNMLEEW